MNENPNILKQSEWLLLNQIILELLQTVTPELLFEKMFNTFRMLLPNAGGYMILYNSDGSVKREQCYCAGIRKEIFEQYLKRYYFLDYMRYVFDLSGNSKVYRDTDILAEEIRVKHEFYVKFLKPNQIPYGAGCVLVKEKSVIGIVNLFRNDELGDFTERDLFVLNVIKDYLTYKITQICTDREKPKYGLAGVDYGLTGRELDIVKRISLGASNLDIASALSITVSTVKKHVYNIYTKTGVRNRVQLKSLIDEHKIEL